MGRKAVSPSSSRPRLARRSVLMPQNRPTLMEMRSHSIGGNSLKSEKERWSSQVSTPLNLQYRYPPMPQAKPSISSARYTTRALSNWWRIVVSSSKFNNPSTKEKASYLRRSFPISLLKYFPSNLIFPASVKDLTRASF